MNCG